VPVNESEIASARARGVPQVLRALGAIGWRSCMARMVGNVVGGVDVVEGVREKAQRARSLLAPCARPCALYVR
jgi:hypothetical protein